DVAVDEHGEVDEEPDLVSQLVHLVQGLLPDLDLVQRDAGQLDEAQAEGVPAPPLVASEQAGPLEAGHVAEHGALAESELGGEGRESLRRLLTREAPQDTGGALHGLAPGADRCRGRDGRHALPSFLPAALLTGTCQVCGPRA